MKVALIGGNSRSARALCRHVRQAGMELELVPIVRRGASSLPKPGLVVDDYFAVDAPMLEGFDAAINFCGLVGRRPEADLIRANADLAGHLAGAARAAGVRHFVQFSSLAVYGPAAFIDLDTPTNPSTPYGRSKLLADERLAALATTSFAVTLLRIPIVYGRGVPSKLQRLAALLRATRLLPVPRPLPRRSVISQENLSRVFVHVLRSRPRGVVFAADPEPFQLDMFAALLPFRCWLLPLPRPALAPMRWLAPGLFASLFASLEISESLLLRPREPLIPTATGLREAFAALDNRQPGADQASSAASAHRPGAERNEGKS